MNTYEADRIAEEVLKELVNNGTRKIYPEHPDLYTENQVLAAVFNVMMREDLK